MRQPSPPLYQDLVFKHYIQAWTSEDEQIVSRQRSQLTNLRSVDPLPKDFYTAHVVAVAVTAAVTTDGNIPILFNGMLMKLKEMHERNPF